MNSTSTSIFAVQSPDLVELRRTRSARGAGTGVTALAPHRPYRSRRRPAAWTARRLAAMRAANWHAPFLLRQLAHFWSFGASRGHFPSLAGAPLRFIGAKRPSLRGVTCPRPSSPRRAQPKCGQTTGFNAFAHSEDRVPGTRHFALLSPSKPTLHSRFPRSRVFFSGTRVIVLNRFESSGL